MLLLNSQSNSLFAMTAIGQGYPLPGLMQKMLRLLPMPRNKKSSPAGNASFESAQFVNINLTKDVLQTIKSQSFTLEALEAGAAELMGDGYKLSLRFDVRNDCYAAWLIAPNSGVNKGYILSGRGSTPVKAFKQLFYIHFVLLERNWVDDQGQRFDVLDD
jgi:hypothetical protein